MQHQDDYSTKDVREEADQGTVHGSSECDAIGDPFRRALCKVCGLPVVGEAPFCSDHESPVP